MSILYFLAPDISPFQMCNFFERVNSNLLRKKLKLRPSGVNGKNFEKCSTY